MNGGWEIGPFSPPLIPSHFSHGVRSASNSMSSDDSSKIPAPTPDDFADDAPPKQDLVIATGEATYILKTEERKDFVPFYDSEKEERQIAVSVGITVDEVQMEFDKCDAEGATVSKRFEMEATMRTIFNCLPNALPTHHLLLCVDLGAHTPWRFLVFPVEYISISQFLSQADNEDKADQAALALRLAMHAFQGIQMLHKEDIVHGDIRPDNLIIGGADTTGLGLELTNMVYASRGRQRNFEGSKKDDIESWIYCMAEFFHKDLVPWLPDCKLSAESGQPGHEADMLKLKRAFCTRKLWKAAKDVLFPEFDQILQLMIQVTGRGEVPYHAIWNCLNSANLYLESSNIFGLAPWFKTNQGAPTTPSGVLCTPVENAPEEFVGKDNPV